MCTKKPLNQETFSNLNRHITYPVKSQFNESRFNVKSRFKVQNLVTKMEFYIEKSRFSVKSRFKKSMCADGGHWLNRDFPVFG